MITSVHLPPKLPLFTLQHHVLLPSSTIRVPVNINNTSLLKSLKDDGILRNSIIGVVSVEDNKTTLDAFKNTINKVNNSTNNPNNDNPTNNSTNNPNNDNPTNNSINNPHNDNTTNNPLNNTISLQKHTHPSNHPSIQTDKESLHRIGTAALVLEYIAFDWLTGSPMVLLTGICRFEIKKIIKTQPYYTSEVLQLDRKESVGRVNVKDWSDKTRQLAINFRQQTRLLVELLQIPSSTLLKLKNLLDNIPIDQLIDVCVSIIKGSFQEKLSILDALDSKDRIRKAMPLLLKQIQEVKSTASKKNSFLKAESKLKLKRSGDDVDSGDENANMEKKISEAGMPMEVEKMVKREMKRMKKMSSMAPDAAVIRNYLEIMIELPWNKCSTDTIDIAKARKDLEREHHGMDKVKERLVEFLAVQKVKIIMNNKNNHKNNKENINKNNKENNFTDKNGIDSDSDKDKVDNGDTKSKKHINKMDNNQEVHVVNKDSWENKNKNIDNNNNKNNNNKNNDENNNNNKNNSNKNNNNIKNINNTNKNNGDNDVGMMIKAPLLCLVGPPGVGKTSIARSVADTLGRQFCRISLGGISDQSDIRGHRRTYIGSMPGRIMQALTRSRVKNPLILLDEIDKMTKGVHGDPAAALLEALDPEQNHAFVDHFVNAPFDLSQVLFIATANSLNHVPLALKDRMEVVDIPGYTIYDKTHIANKHLLPKQCQRHGLIFNTHIQIPLTVIKFIIINYTREAGVRGLEKKLAAVLRAVAVRVAENQDNHDNNKHTEDSNNMKNNKEVNNEKSNSVNCMKNNALNLIGENGGDDGDSGVVKCDGCSGRDEVEMVQSKGLFPIVIDQQATEDILGPPQHHDDPKDRVNTVGVAVGLAWTAHGGEVLYVEARKMAGRGRIVMTGQLGAVMKESASLALAWLNTHAAKLGISSYEPAETDFHIHFPAAAISKDGPSAGITIATALVSLVTNRKVRSDTAMTGELTLTGFVLPVGGIKEKVLAAHMANIHRIILPHSSRNQLRDISQSIMSSMEVVLVKKIEDVLVEALSINPTAPRLPCKL